MRYFFDTEFDEDGKTIEMISIGIVAEDGREYYAVSNEFDPAHCNQWVRNKVLSLLPPEYTWKPRKQIANEIVHFVGWKPEFWAYYADYDWIVMCQLYGRMFDLPHEWPMFCMDIKQYAVMMGNPTLPNQAGTEHDALEDARWNKLAFEYLKELENVRSE